MAYFGTLRCDLKRFNEVFGEVRVNRLKPADLESYQLRRLREGAAKKSIDDHIAAAKTTLTKALSEADLIEAIDTFSANVDQTVDHAETSLPKSS